MKHRPRLYHLPESRALAILANSPATFWSSGMLSEFGFQILTAERQSIRFERRVVSSSTAPNGTRKIAMPGSSLKCHKPASRKPTGNSTTAARSPSDVTRPIPIRSSRGADCRRDQHQVEQCSVSVRETKHLATNRIIQQGWGTKSDQAFNQKSEHNPCCQRNPALADHPRTLGWLRTRSHFSHLLSNINYPSSAIVSYSPTSTSTSTRLALRRSRASFAARNRSGMNSEYQPWRVALRFSGLAR